MLLIVTAPLRESRNKRLFLSRENGAACMWNNVLVEYNFFLSSTTCAAEEKGDGFNLIEEDGGDKRSRVQKRRRVYIVRGWAFGGKTRWVYSGLSMYRIPWNARPQNKLF